MMNCKLAVAGNVSLEASNASQLTCNKPNILNKVKRAIANFDRSAQTFFNAQASVRGRKSQKTQWGIERNEGFF